MNELFIFVSSLFFLWAIRSAFFWVALWQENDYRLDRFFASFKKRIRRPKLFFVFFLLCKLTIFFSYIYIIFNDDLLLLYQYFIVGLYIFQSFLVIREIYQNQLKKPQLTLRVNSILILTFTTIFLFFVIPLADRFLWLLFLDLSMPFFIGFYIFLFLFPIEIYTEWRIEKAVRKIRAQKNLIVIAVSGSVGKSSTKDYIAAILGRKFNVIKTEGKNNTAIGLARTISKKLTPTTDIFVAEISAYQQGEIRLLCELIRPQIGVLTAINNNHLSLFKSLEVIKKTNYELVEALPRHGVCLFNGNNKNTVSLYKKSRKTKVIYLTANEGEVPSQGVNEIVAYSVLHRQKRITGKYFLNKKVSTFQTNLSVNIEQLLPAIYLASYLGMSDREIKNAIGLLK